MERISKAIEKIKTPAVHPQFYSRIFIYLAKKNRKKEDESSNSICNDLYLTFSHYLDLTGIQESTAVRNVLLANRLAHLLINDEGELEISLLASIEKELTCCLYCLGPERSHDALRMEHIKHVVQLLQKEDKLRKLLKMASRPSSNALSEQMIRDTLRLSSHTALEDMDARRAVLSAWMTYLRQSVGSCFATAPAILVQSEQPELFLKDLIEIISTGRLKRTFGGIEYVVPLSRTWGGGDLRKRFAVGRLIEDSPMQVWNSPGLVQAVLAVKLIKGDSAFQDRVKQLKDLLTPIFLEWKEPGELITVSIELILQELLKKHFEITDADIEEYNYRPRAMIQSSLMMQSSQGGGGKGKKCGEYFRLLDEAFKAFKLIADNPLLKSWEFTLASFAETKAHFTKWNLYSSLGLHYEEAGGIGEAMFVVIKAKLDEANRKAQDLQSEYEMVYQHVKLLEGRLRHSSEEEGRFVKMEYQSKLSEFRTLEELREMQSFRAQKIAGSFQSITDKLYELFPDYFQEIYDADMHDVASTPYDDSPAGFRLLYKHGRTNTSSWTFIHNAVEFVEALVAFFMAAEHQLHHDANLEGLDSDLSEIITQAVNHIRSERFLESAFDRMALAHHQRPIKDPLKNLDKIDKKPWAYTSGGTVETLVKCYWKRESELTKTARWVESPLELLVFLIDTMKKAKDPEIKKIEKGSKFSMLMHSPTHAFLFKPAAKHILEGWKIEAYTYTWVRDYLVSSREAFIDNMRLDQEKAAWVIQEIAQWIPQEFRDYFGSIFKSPPRGMRVVELRDYILENIRHAKKLWVVEQHYLTPDKLDAFLYENLPLFHSYQLEKNIQTIFEEVGLPVELLRQVYEMLPENRESKVMSAKQLREICLGLLMLEEDRVSFEYDYALKIARAAQKLGLAMPEPIVFADTNWMKDDFAFVVSPGTGELELWRVDHTGTIGAPMSIWKEWVDGSRKDREWGLYTHLSEYR